MADDITPNLALPYIMPAQAQKHVTHNEAIRFLDALVQLSVVTMSLTAPPDAADNGARYIVGTDATGDWAGQDGSVAAFQDGAWAFYPPRIGWIAWVADDGALMAWNGTAWDRAGGGTNPVDLVGVNATADTINRLALSSAASLFNHDGAGHQLKINKAEPTDTASLLFQTGFSGRAEMGTTGDDRFHIKVSDDGSTWQSAIAASSTGVALSGNQVEFLDDEGNLAFKLDIADEEIDFSQGYLKGREAWFTGTTDNPKHVLLQIDGEVGENHSGVLIALNGDSDPYAIAMNFQTDQPGPLTTIYQNNDTGGNPIAHARAVYRILPGGGGDAYSRFEKPGTAEWSIGYRNSSDNSFRITRNHDLGGNTKVELFENRVDLLEHVRVGSISGKTHNWDTVWFGGGNADGTDSTVAVGGPLGPHYGIAVRADADIAWSASAGEAKGARDLALWRDAAGRLALRNGTASQALRVYATFTDAGNYERASLSCDGDTATLAAETAGTGASDMDVALVPVGDGRVKFGAHSTLGSETVTGYIEIKDSSGAIRKLAVLS